MATGRHEYIGRKDAACANADIAVERHPFLQGNCIADLDCVPRPHLDLAVEPASCADLNSACRRGVKDGSRPDLAAPSDRYLVLSTKDPRARVTAYAAAGPL